MTQAATNSQQTLEQIARRVFGPIQEELVEVEHEFMRQLRSNIHIISQIGEYLHNGGGKRIRPALLLLANRLFDRPVTQSVIRLATVVECLHTATLVHDDIIDDAELRRGRPSVNRVWGNEITVLMGDWLYMSAFETALQERSFEVLDILTSLTRKMTEGELIQLAQIGNTAITIDEYLDVIRRKTAYLFSACTEIGAIMGGATASQQHALRDFGLNLGMAFQLIDDVLDFTSTDHVLGKPVGNDLREGKLTLPVIYFLQQATPEYLSMVESVIREQDYRHVERSTFVHLLEELGVLDQARSVAREYASQARLLVEDFPPSPSKTALVDITLFVTERSK
jgi:octaprenyl-diphosphate synthase